VVVALGGLLFVFSLYAFGMGGAGMLEGARFERCSGCGRHGLVVKGRLHARGCPYPSYRQRIHHLRDSWSGCVHLGHR